VGHAKDYAHKVLSVLTEDTPLTRRDVIIVARACEPNRFKVAA